jgi:hypothetical protein
VGTESLNVISINFSLKRANGNSFSAFVGYTTFNKNARYRCQNFPEDISDQ